MQRFTYGEIHGIKGGQIYIVGNCYILQHCRVHSWIQDLTIQKIVEMTTNLNQVTGEDWCVFNVKVVLLLMYVLTYLQCLVSKWPICMICMINF